MGALQCPSCGRNHETSGGVVDYFSLLGVQRKFRVDLATAESQYKRMQFLVHPDRNEQQTAPDYCALLNEAISTLKNPLMRAEHLLDIHEIQKTSEQDRVQDSGLLMEIMEINEAIDDAAQERNELENILKTLTHQIEKCENRINVLYENSNLKEMKQEVERMRFFVRTIDRVQQLLRF
jgi:molecular chaperone HscB